MADESSMGRVAARGAASTRCWQNTSTSRATRTTTGTTEAKRLDFSASPDGSLSVVAELKRRPGDLIGLDELMRLTGAVDYLRGPGRESNDPLALNPP